MTSQQARESRRLLRQQVATQLGWNSLVLGGLLVVGYLGFVCTQMGQALDNAGYAGRIFAGGSLQTYDFDILGEVTSAHVLFVLGALFFLSLLLRCPFAGLIVVCAAAAAIFGAEFLKSILPREMLSMPTVPVPPYFANDTYPSGHTTVGTALILAFMVLTGARLRPWAAVLAGLISASYATAVCFIGWHRPSDALGGILWSGLCLAIASAFLVYLNGHHAAPTQKVTGYKMSAWITAGLLIAFTIVVFRQSGNTDIQIPFYLMSVIIIFSAFAVPAWLAFILRNIEWRSLHRF